MIENNDAFVRRLKIKIPSPYINFVNDRFYHINSASTDVSFLFVWNFRSKSSSLFPFKCLLHTLFYFSDVTFKLCNQLLYHHNRTITDIYLKSWSLVYHFHFFHCPSVHPAVDTLYAIFFFHRKRKKNHIWVSFLCMACWLKKKDFNHRAIFFKKKAPVRHYVYIYVCRYVCEILATPVKL